MTKSRGSSVDILEEDYLNEDVSTSDKSSRLALKSGDSQLHQCYNITPFDPKNKRA